MEASLTSFWSSAAAEMVTFGKTGTFRQSIPYKLS
jgi:hypothetical protein